jgi:L-alanine-DL-glutamate epimerase-like enolase superfamily enzyme
MRIESVDFFYLSMPIIKDIGDGSQDACLVRVRAGGFEGWGECESAPLPTIAAFVCPMSHSACKPVSSSVLGQEINNAADIRRIGDQVRLQSFDLLQADHTLSGIDIALWDLLGRKEGTPAWALLGYKKAAPKLPYASVLFGNTPAETMAKGRTAVSRGYKAVKFGWGPYGHGTVQDDADQVFAAREGIGGDALLLVDAGTAFGENVDAATLRLPALEAARATWLEEPFVASAFDSYGALAKRCNTVKLAGGEGSHNAQMAQNLLQHGGVGFIQIDTGRIGGITTAFEVAQMARSKGAAYVNHTFTTPLALSASLQPYAGLEADTLCEVPLEATDLAANLTTSQITMDAQGHVFAPNAPGLGLQVNLKTVKTYALDLQIKIGGKVLYETPQI